MPRQSTTPTTPTARPKSAAKANLPQSYRVGLGGSIMLAQRELDVLAAKVTELRGLIRETFGHILSRN